MPITTRAAIAFAPHQALSIHEVVLADPGPGEVLVKLLASGICHSDLHVIDTVSPQSFPIILGHEGIGDVVAVGEAVTGFVPGDRVMPFLVPDCGECDYCRSGRTNLCLQLFARHQEAKTPFSLNGQPVASFMGLGTFAEMTVVNADMLTKVNRSARPDHACCIACGVTTGLGAALISAKVTRGSSVAVFGAGGVGLSVVQGANIAGAEKIIAIDTNSAKADVAFKMGATDFINPKNIADIVTEIQKLSGHGVDFAFDCVGQPSLARQALECTNPAWGVAVNVGVYAPGKTLEAEPMSLVFGRRWTGSLMGGAKRQDVSRFVDMYVAGDYDLDNLVSHSLAHQDINLGFDMMRSGESVRSVIVY